MGKDTDDLSEYCEPMAQECFDQQSEGFLTMATAVANLALLGVLLMVFACMIGSLVASCEMACKLGYRLTRYRLAKDLDKDLDSFKQGQERKI